MNLLLSAIKQSAPIQQAAVFLVMMIAMAVIIILLARKRQPIFVVYPSTAGGYYYFVGTCRATMNLVVSERYETAVIRQGQAISQSKWLEVCEGDPRMDAIEKVADAIRRGQMLTLYLGQRSEC